MSEKELNDFLKKNCQCRNCNRYENGICKMRDDKIGPNGLCAAFWFADEDLESQKEKLFENWYEEHLKEIGEAV